MAAVTPMAAAATAAMLPPPLAPRFTMLPRCPRPPWPTPRLRSATIARSFRPAA
jgi:hypothetical protein